MKDKRDQLMKAFWSWPVAKRLREEVGASRVYESFSVASAVMSRSDGRGPDVSQAGVDLSVTGKNVMSVDVLSSL